MRKIREYLACANPIAAYATLAYVAVLTALTLAASLAGWW